MSELNMSISYRSKDPKLGTELTNFLEEFGVNRSPTSLPSATGDELGAAETIILTFIVFPILKAAVEFAAKEAMQRFKDWLQKRKKAGHDVKGIVVLKIDENDPGRSLNPEKDLPLFDELYSQYAEK
jgi:hypothetical protein